MMFHKTFQEQKRLQKNTEIFYEIFQGSLWSIFGIEIFYEISYIFSEAFLFFEMFPEIFHYLLTHQLPMHQQLVHQQWQYFKK